MRKTTKAAATCAAAESAAEPAASADQPCAERPPMEAQTPRIAAPTKLQRLIELLSRPQGATLAEMTETTGWQAHSVRGAMAGGLKKKGFTIGSAKADNVRRYHIEVVGGEGAR